MSIVTDQKFVSQTTVQSGVVPFDVKLNCSRTSPPPVPPLPICYRPGRDGGLQLREWSFWPLEDSYVCVHLLAPVVLMTIMQCRSCQVLVPRLCQRLCHACQTVQSISCARCARNEDGQSKRLSANWLSDDCQQLAVKLCRWWWSVRCRSEIYHQRLSAN